MFFLPITFMFNDTSGRKGQLLHNPNFTHCIYFFTQQLRKQDRKTWFNKKKLMQNDRNLYLHLALNLERTAEFFYALVWLSFIQPYLIPMFAENLNQHKVFGSPWMKDFM